MRLDAALLGAEASESCSRPNKGFREMKRQAPLFPQSSCERRTSAKVMAFAESRSDLSQRLKANGSNQSRSAFDAGEWLTRSC